MYLLFRLWICKRKFSVFIIEGTYSICNVVLAYNKLIQFMTLIKLSTVQSVLNFHSDIFFYCNIWKDPHIQILPVNRLKTTLFDDQSTLFRVSMYRFHLFKVHTSRKTKGQYYYLIYCTTSESYNNKKKKIKYFIERF